MIKYFIQFLLASKNEHSLHSPFVFELYTKIVKDKKLLSIYREIENLRKKLLKNTSIIEITDFGAGSKIYKKLDKLPKVLKSLLSLANCFTD
jgi:hypothetical protein